MRFSEAWLRTYVDPPVATHQLAAQLTMAGLEVDSVEPVAAPFSGVVVAEVLNVEPHPQADRLRICQVSTGDVAVPLTIVCGAPNVRAGMKAPLAVEGAVLPEGLQIKRSELRGVLSRGMLCSAKELGMEDSQGGLMVLPEDAPVGTDLREYLHLDDFIIDVDLTPNRADCLSIEGIARETALLNDLDWCAPTPPTVAAITRSMLPVTVDAGAACPRYLGRMVKGINQTTATPLWMRERLRRSGLRSLGPVVDVTNYVLLELGQPLHAFDAAKVEGGIRVRLGISGERLMLLNDQEITLDDQVLVIADQQRPLALAGVMGGKDSAVSDTTTDIFLECAFFSPTAIMGRARRFGLNTDSSHRFERGVDPQLQRRAIERATELLLSVAGGEAGPIVEVTAETHLPIREPILLRRHRIGSLLGVSLADDQTDRLLRRLGMELEPHAEGWLVTPPSFRFDVAIEADLVEEIGRVYGYDHIPRRNPLARVELQRESEAELDVERVKDVLVDRGYQEAITYSFVDAAKQASIEPELQSLPLRNPISADLAVMRTGLWCGLLDAALRNSYRQQARIRLFEAGLRFVKRDGEIVQEKSLAGLAMGSVHEEQWGEPTRPVDFFDVKADLEAILRLSGHERDVVFAAGKHPALHPGQTAEILIGERDHLGWLGMLHPRLEREMGFETGVFLFELDQNLLLRREIPRFNSLSRFPQVRRDIAIIVDESVTASSLVACVQRQCPALIRQVVIFDVYQGKGIESGKKSVALGMVLQDDAETLTDTRVDDLVADLLVQMGQEFNAQLRN